MSMTLLPFEDRARVRGVLLQCDEFKTNAQLRAALDGELLPFRDRVPEANTPQQRVDNVIDYLQDKQVGGNCNALVVFLEILASRYNSEDERSAALQRSALLVDAGGARGGKIEVPYVVVAMKDAEARDLILGGLPQVYIWPIQVGDREGVAAFRGELHTVGLDLDVLVGNYAPARDEWCPFGPGKGSFAEILAQLEAYLNGRPQRPHRKQLPGIRLQSYSEAFFAADYEMRQDTHRRLRRTGCIFVVDAVSLFHADLRNKWLRSELGSTSPVLILSPVDADSIAPNQRIMREFMQRELEWAFSRFANEPTELCEFRSGNPVALKRWLTMVLSEQAMALSSQPDQATVAELQSQSGLRGRMAGKLFGRGG
jgi:hypothetical protein